MSLSSGGTGVPEWEDGLERLLALSIEELLLCERCSEAVMDPARERRALVADRSELGMSAASVSCLSLECFCMIESLLSMRSSRATSCESI